MSDDRLDENTPATPWFMRQVSEERGEGEHRPSFPAWLQQEDDDSAAADVAALENIDDAGSESAAFAPADLPAVEDATAEPVAEADDKDHQEIEESVALEAAQSEQIDAEPVEAVSAVADSLAPTDAPAEGAVADPAEGAVAAPAVTHEAGLAAEHAVVEGELLAQGSVNEAETDFAASLPVSTQDTENAAGEIGAVAAEGATPDATEAVEATQATDVTDATEAVATTDATEAVATTDATEAVEATQATEASESVDVTESVDATAVTYATEAAPEAASLEEAVEIETPLTPEPVEFLGYAQEEAAAVVPAKDSAQTDAHEHQEVSFEAVAEVQDSAAALPPTPEDAQQVPVSPEPAPEPAPEVTDSSGSDAQLGTASSTESTLPPLTSRRARRQASWLDALEDQKRQEELAATPSTQEDDAAAPPVAAAAALSPDFGNAEADDATPAPDERGAEARYSADAANTTDAADAAKTIGAADAADVADPTSRPEVETTAVRRYSLLAAVGATPTAAATWKPTEAEGSSEEAPLSDGSYRAAPAATVLGMPVDKQVAPAPVEQPTAPIEPDWRDALQSPRTDTSEENAVPSAGEEDRAPAWNPLTESDAVTTTGAQAESKNSSEAGVLEGASIKPAPVSRAAAHWWSVFFTLLLVPIGWFLVTDATSQLMGSQLLEEGREVTLLAAPIWPLTELVLGALAVALAVFVARWSSVGSILLGSILTAVGGLFAFAPQQVSQWFGPLLNDFLVYNTATQRFTLSFLADGVSGRVLLGGIVLIFLGVVSHGARRQGRREQANYDLVGRRKRHRK